jgi:hypothetical protein
MTIDPRDKHMINKQALRQQHALMSNSLQAALHLYFSTRILPILRFNCD